MTGGWMTLTSTRGVGGDTAPAFLANTGMPLLFGVCGVVEEIAEAALHPVTSVVEWSQGRLSAPPAEAARGRSPRRSK